MRSSLVPAFWIGLAALTLANAAPPGAPAAAAPARQDSTPIVNPPGPTPRPIYVPYLNKAWDPLSPEPVTNVFKGWLAVLQPDGRTACAPATHVLLRYAEGTLDNPVEGVVAPAVADMVLDLFVGDYVELRGGVDLAPEGCRITWRLVRANRVRSAEPPPP